MLLASASPRRAALLVAAGIPFDVADFPPLDETPPRGPAGEPLAAPEVARRLALRKVRAAALRAPHRLVLAADTLVFLPDEVLGKPRDASDAERILVRLSGREHRVATGVALRAPGAPPEAREVSGVAIARVRFRRLEPAEIRAYVAGGEPLDKAGAYAIQGDGAAFVEALDGDRDTVIGLPMALVRALLRDLTGPGSNRPAPGPAGR
jgi:septum formation protein